MSGEHELPTASVVRYVASDARPPPWTTLHRCQTRRASTYRSQFGVQTTGATSSVRAVQGRRQWGWFLVRVGIDGGRRRGLGRRTSTSTSSEVEGV